ncbi:tRNase Z TRZ3, mitochondrial [Impatiens glandulifera]|uniref:tRNase Z TRZ3, mitochondrial n=1 Tax=Impatiens glandulifera TaxID=253017 RepID=UPI001FB15015|nr:tRNase Z TRZ3, mitochondrial [Impatiens glandulifera]
MPQLPSLRLLLSSASYQTSPLKFSSFSNLFRPRSSPSFRRRTIFTSSASYPNRHRDKPSSRPLNLSRRKGSSSMDDIEDNGSIGFNKRRAEGKDKSDLPKKTLKLKDAKLNPVNTICYLQVLGTGMDTQDTSPSVLLFFDKQRFIFNAGEGLQRFCTEHKIKLSKIDHIFLSRVCSETAGGLPGLLLTLAGIGEEGMSVNVWGPSDLNYLVTAMRSFIPGASMVNTKTFEMSESTEPEIVVENEVVKISVILLQPDPVVGQNTKNDNHLLSKAGDISAIYVCELPEIKGKFYPEKAIALGLKPGPKYRQLQLGQSVKSDRKNIMVHPSDVMDPSIPGPIVLVVDCPTVYHLGEIAYTESLQSFYGGISKTVNCIIHLSPLSVVNTDEYQFWMTRFVGAQHIVAGHQPKNVEIPILKSSAKIAAWLNYLCPQFFPSPGIWSLQKQEGSYSKASNEDPSSEPCKTISAENLLKFWLRPSSQFGLDRSGVPSLASTSDVIKELFSEIPDIESVAKQISKFWDLEKDKEEDMVEEPWLSEEDDVLPSCLEDISREEMEIVLLGTGSSQPSKYRNVSAVFINLFSKGSLLFDCGEGTLGQLKRRFGLEGADKAIRGLRFIWISHIHADHHTGLARILALRRDLLKDEPHAPIVVIGPRQLKRYLDAYQRLENLDMLFLDCQNTEDSTNDGQKDVDSNLFTRGSPMRSYWKRLNGGIANEIASSIMNDLEKTLKEAGLESLVSFPVVHCPQSYGVALKASNRVNCDGKVIPGWKIVYSGDTRPCPQLVKASRGATVLIHEATFEDGMGHEAIAKNHSTTKEAIEVGDLAGVYRIILTHFSQRYPKIPVFDETHMHKTSIAFDLMSVNLADLPMLPKVLPFLKLLFKDEMIAVDDESEDVVLADAGRL